MRKDELLPAHSGQMLGDEPCQGLEKGGAPAQIRTVPVRANEEVGHAVELAVVQDVRRPRGVEGKERVLCAILLALPVLGEPDREGLVAVGGLALAPIGDAVGLPGVTRDADVGGQAADRGVELGVGVALDGHAVVDHQAVSVHEAQAPNEEERADVPSRRPQRAGAQSGKHKPHRRGPEKDRRDGHPVLEVADREVEVVRQNPGEGVQEDGGAEERERRPGCRRQAQRDQGQQKGDDHEGGGGSQRLGNACQAVGEAAADGEEGRREGPADVGDGVLEGKHFQAALWPEGGLALRFGQRVDGTGVGARERVGKPGHRAEQDEQCVPLQPPHDRAPRPEQPEDPLGGDDHRHGGGIDDRGNHGARESSPFAP